MRSRTVPIAIALLLVAALPLAAAGGAHDDRVRVTVTDTFTDGVNMGGWTFGTPSEFIEETGGVPKEFLHNTFVASHAPQPRTMPVPGNPFLGNWQEMGVRSVRAAFKIFSVNLATTEERPLTLVLTNFNGTPKDPFDDSIVFLVGRKNIPNAGIRNPGGKLDPDRASGWPHYNFRIPSDSTTLPEPRSTVEWEYGWAARENGDWFAEPADPDAVWNRVLRQVDEVRFVFHDPRLFALIQDWDLGMDSVSMTYVMD